MPDYHWKGITKKGKLVWGTDNANSNEKLKQKLLEEKVALLSFKEKKEIRKSINTHIQKSLLQKNITEKHLAQFFHDLSVLLESGITIAQALGLSRKYTKTKSLHKLIEALEKDISHGYSFSKALENQNKNLSQLIIHTIRAGEHSGNLQSALAKLATYLEKKRKFYKKTS